MMFVSFFPTLIDTLNDHLYFADTDKYMNGGCFQGLHKLFLLLWLTGTTTSIHELAATSEHLLLGLHLLKTPSLRHAMLLMSQAL